MIDSNDIAPNKLGGYIVHNLNGILALFSNHGNYPFQFIIISTISNLLTQYVSHCNKILLLVRFQ